MAEMFHSCLVESVLLWNIFWCGLIAEKTHLSCMLPMIPVSWCVCFSRSQHVQHSLSLRVPEARMANPGCWLKVSAEHSGQLRNHYCHYATGKIWTPCHLSSNFRFLINLTCVFLLALATMCVYVFTRARVWWAWHSGRGNGMSLSMGGHILGKGNRWVRNPAL